MRSIIAGIILLLCSSLCLAQTKGEVESIGFGGYFRPDCWTPMVVRLRPGTIEPGTYQIQVEQKDLDEDTQVFTRIITVNSGDQAKEQRFSMYFIPQPQSGGLPDTLRELNAEMKVWLCNEQGKQMEALPITAAIQSIDSPKPGKVFGRKFILCVTDGTNKPLFQDYSQAFGVTEDVAMIVVRPDELPESTLGFDGVDAIVWMSGDANLLSAGGARRLPALTEYVKLGGKLIVTQPGDRSRVEALEPLLPIKLKDAAGNWLIEPRDRANLSPLSDWARPRPLSGMRNPWLSPRGTFKVAYAKSVVDGALVSETINWNDADAKAAPDESPYLVRKGLGLGEVVWVAQNLGDIALTGQIQTGWMGVWDKVLDLKSDPRLLIRGANIENEKIEKAYVGGGPVDMGPSLLDAMEHSARGASLVVLAIGFFIIYWVLAGPVAFLILNAKKKKGMSWQIFAASAIGATLLTVGVVKLVLGATADIHHITFVRMAAGQPAVVESRLGIYLTKSSNIAIALQKNDPNYASYVTAFAPHPQSFQSVGGFVGKERYDVTIPETGAADVIKIDVPFRSTLKKVQARWVGQLPSVEGFPKIEEATIESKARLDGKLTNSTGRNLIDVYFAFTGRSQNGERWEDHIFYLPRWAKDGQLDLGKELSGVGVRVKYGSAPWPNSARPGDGKVIEDQIVAASGNTVNNDDWPGFWYEGLRSNSGSGTLDSAYDRGYIRSFPMISLFDRLPAVKNDGSTNRFDLLHRGARRYDMSQAMAAGQLVILAQDAANNDNGKTLSTLPYPIEVDRDTVTGTGVTFYQITLPLTRVVPTTQPTTQAVEK